MNYTGFDGLNCTLTLSPREFKVLYETLIRVPETSHDHVAVLMRAAGFKGYYLEDVKAIIRQSVLVMQPLGSAISFQGADENKPDETAQEISKKLLTN